MIHPQTEGLYESFGIHVGDCETPEQSKTKEHHVDRQAHIQVADSQTLALVTDLETDPFL